MRDKFSYSKTPVHPGESGEQRKDPQKKGERAAGIARVNGNFSWFGHQFGQSHHGAMSDLTWNRLRLSSAVCAFLHFVLVLVFNVVRSDMAQRLRCADLFCGAGGAAMGLHRAGFEVEGWDIAPQKNYPFKFNQGDALLADLSGFDFVWASPPCQAYTKASLSQRNAGKVYPEPTLLMVPHCQHHPNPCVVVGHGTTSWARLKNGGKCHTIQENRDAMGIDWMNRGELSQAIPPAYSEYLGKQIIATLT